MSHEELSIPGNSMLGKLKIYSLSKDVVYKPMMIQQWEFDVCAGQHELIKIYNTRENLCEKLSTLVNLKSKGEQDGQFADLMSI